MRELNESDVEFETMRSGGPGGQHGDRRSTAVRLRVDFEEIPLTDEELDYLREHLPPKNRTRSEEMIVECGEHRSQKRNRKRAVEIANDEINSALESGRRQKKEEKHQQRFKRRSKGGGDGDDDESLEERRKKQRRSETTDDLIEDAYEEAPDLMERYLNGEKDPDEEGS